MTATYQQYILNFKRPSATSRGILTQKETWFLILEEDGKRGVGECGILRSLSIDDRPDYEEKLKWTCDNIHLGEKELLGQLQEFPSIGFGLEMAFRSLNMDSPFELFPSEFTRGEAAIPINGLVWMGEKAFMKEQIIQKIKEGFRCIKLKIGAIDFDAEIDLLKYIRSEFTSEDIEIRVDANGAFSPSEALGKLKKLSEFQLHSIEQPIKQGQRDEMAVLCQKTPLPIALDEELIGIFGVTKKREMLQITSPGFLVLKPSLLGGYREAEEWINLAEEKNIDWWITSALESNVGLNAIAQFTFELGDKIEKRAGRKPKMNIQTSVKTFPQGLGTGALYTNNFDSPLRVERGHLHYDPQLDWDLNL